MQEETTTNSQPKTKPSYEGTADITPNSTGFTRAELIQKYEDMPLSDALMQLPGDMSYQSTFVDACERCVEACIAAKKKTELRAKVHWEDHFDKKPTGQEREWNAQLIAGEEWDHIITLRKTEYSLAKSAYEYMERKDIALRKLASMQQ